MKRERSLLPWRDALEEAVMLAENSVCEAMCACCQRLASAAQVHNES